MFTAQQMAICAHSDTRLSARPTKVARGSISVRSILHGMRSRVPAVVGIMTVLLSGTLPIATAQDANPLVLENVRLALMNPESFTRDEFDSYELFPFSQRLHEGQSSWSRSFTEVASSQVRTNGRSFSLSGTAAKPGDVVLLSKSANDAKPYVLVYLGERRFVDDKQKREDSFFAYPFVRDSGLELNTFPARLHLRYMLAKKMVKRQPSNQSIIPVGNFANGGSFIHQSFREEGESVSWFRGPHSQGGVFLKCDWLSAAHFRLLRLNRYHGFSPQQRQIVENHLLEAVKMSEHAAGLLKNLSNTTRNAATDALLQDVFGIRLNDGARRTTIRNKFESFESRVERLIFVFSNQQLDTGAEDEKAEMDFGAWVTRDRQDRIFISPKFFTAESTERAPLLIHEAVHLMRCPGHPGGVRVSFEREPLNIPASQAIANPYCYQYFALWAGAIP